MAGRNFARLIAINFILAGLILAPPYFFGPVALRVGVELAVGLFLGGWLLFKLWRGEGLPGTPLDGPIAALLLVGLAGMALSANPRLSLDSLFFLVAPALAYYCLVDALRRPGVRALWAEAVVRLGVVMGLVSLVVLADWYFGLGLWWRPPGWFGIGGWAEPIPPTRLRVGVGPPVWPTIASVYLGFAWAFALGQLLSATSAAGRRVGLFSLGFIGLALLTTYTRGAWLGALASAAVFALASAPNRWLGGRRLVAAAAFGLPVATLAFLIAVEGVKGRLISSDLMRLELARVALAAFAERPLLGGGPSTFGQLVLAHQWSPFVDVVREHAHNAYLNLLAEQGLTGLLVSGWLAFAFAALAWRGWRTLPPGPARAAYLAPQAALAGLAAHSLFNYFFNVPGVLFYTTLAGALAVAGAGAVGLGRGRLRPALALAGWAGVMAITLWSEAAAYHQEVAVAEARKENWRGTAAALARAVALDPAFGLYHMQLALAYGHLAAQEPGAGWEERALDHLRRGMLYEGNYGRNWAHLGLLLWQAGNGQGAVAALRRATELDPSDYRYPLALGRFLEEEGAKEGALAAYARALAVAPAIAASPFWQQSALRRESQAALYERALEATRELPSWLAPLHRGELARLAGDYARALGEYGGRSELGLGKVYLALGQHEEALAHLGRALGAGEPKMPVYMARAQVYMAQGRHEEAARDLQTALFVSSDTLPGGSPEAARAYFYLGQIKERQGDLAGAIAYYAQGLPVGWAWTYYEPNVWRRPAVFPPELPALRELSIVKSTPEWQEPYYALGRAYERAGRPAEATLVYREIRKLDYSVAAPSISSPAMERTGTPAR